MIWRKAKQAVLRFKDSLAEGLLERIVSSSVYKAEDGGEKEGWLEAGHMRTVVWPRR